MSELWDTRPAATPAGRPLQAWLRLGLGTIAAVSLAVMAIGLRPATPFRPTGGVGSLQAVTLVNGQVYFGRVDAVLGAQIVLSDVFEGVSNVNPQTNQRSTQLVRRLTSDWHRPADMAIPIDKILFTETIGGDSTVGKALLDATSPTK